MYIINKIVGCLVSPAGFGMALVFAAVLARMLGRRRLAGWGGPARVCKLLGVVHSVDGEVDGRGT